MQVTVKVTTEHEYVNIVRWLAQVHGAIERRRDMWKYDTLLTFVLRGSIGQAHDMERAMNRLKKTYAIVEN